MSSCACRSSSEALEHAGRAGTRPCAHARAGYGGDEARGEAQGMRRSRAASYHQPLVCTQGNAGSNEAGGGGTDAGAEEQERPSKRAGTHTHAHIYAHTFTCAHAPVVDDGNEAKGEADAEGHGYGVLGVGGHALEDLARANHGSHNGGQARLRQHNVGGATRRVSRVRHSDPYICLLQGGRVVHAITCTCACVCQECVCDFDAQACACGCSESAGVQTWSKFESTKELRWWVGVSFPHYSLAWSRARVMRELCWFVGSSNAHHPLAASKAQRLATQNAAHARARVTHACFTNRHTR